MSKNDENKYFLVKLKKNAKAQKANSLSYSKIWLIIVLVIDSIVLKGTFDVLSADSTSLKNLFEFFI
jgi:hypothetical protein